MSENKSRTRSCLSSALILIGLLFFGAVALSMILSGITTPGNSTTEINSTVGTEQADRSPINEEFSSTATEDSPPPPQKTPTLLPNLAPTVETRDLFVGKAIVQRNANLRAGPGTDHEIIGSASAGQELTIYARTEDGWLQLDEEGEKWIGITLVELESSIEDIPLPNGQVPIQHRTPNTSSGVTQIIATPSETPFPDSAGLTNWLEYEGAYIGVRDLRWDYSLRYFRAERGKILVSLYLVAVNRSEFSQTFSEYDFSLIDGGREITGGVVFSEVEPSFSNCTVLPGGMCEGWWTTMIWDRPEVREDLAFVWDPPCFLCENLKAPISQE